MGEKKSAVIRHAAAAGCVAFSAYHLWTTAFGMPVAYLHRPVFVTFAMALGFAMYSSRGRKQPGGASWPDIALALICLVCFGTVAAGHEVNAERLSMVDPLSAWQLVAGGAGVILILELTRRVVGWVLSAVTVAALAYAFLGPYMPHMLAHKGFTVVDVIDYMSFGLNGIYSLPVGVASTYIIIFIIFGTFLEKTGAGDVIMDMGRALAGRYRGGPAKIAVLTSAFFGSISGSAAANVYATGTFTIPLMKRLGYSASFAGAVEASASTGGQLMPPIMGAAAFLMADILGIPYLKICAAALIPSLLYFSSLIFMIDFEAAQKGLKGLEPSELPLMRQAFKRSYLLLPILVLLAAMILGYTPFLAAFAATASTILVTFFSKKTRMNLRRILAALKESAERTVLIATACAAAGIIIGVVTMTGIGLNISSIIIRSSGGHVIVALMLVMIASIIMGMGTPTTVAYIIVATLGVPSLVQLGFDVLPAHFFVFYFGVLSMVTPPVAIAVYAAAEIAQEDIIKIGFAAVKLCFVAFFIPFVFIFDSSLLMQGAWPGILFEFGTAMVGVIALSASFQGWLFAKLGRLFRAALFGCAILLITPGLASNLGGLVGFTLLAGGALVSARRKKSARAAVA
ncbi:MAG: TRAP transporter fused permease subunit [Desulfobacterales bacterium]|jgi:TRAP transporter 4TM/12TM fusion protein|nr:TRAP transporter fused permease subunit [Desulfobacterales bacterium]